MSDIQLSTGNPLEIAARVLLDIHAGADWPMEHWDEPVAPDSVALMRQAKETVRGRSLVFVPGLGWWKYSRERGRWVPVKEHDLRFHILLYDGKKYGKPKEDREKQVTWTLTQITGARENDILSKMKTIVTAEDFFTDAPPSFALSSHWTAVVQGGKLEFMTPHPDWRCRVGLDSDAHQPPHPQPLLDAIHRVIDRPDTVEPERDAHRAQFFEWLGLSMLGIATRYQRGLVIIGDFGGGNGKGWLMDLVASLFPPDAVKQTTGTLDLKMDFNRGALAGRRVLICREMDQVTSIKSLNGLVAGDTLDGRRLNAGDRENFDFRSTMGVAMDVNLNLPILHKDGLGGVLRRWCPLWAVNKLTGDMTRAELDKLTEERRVGLALFALQAAQKVIERRKLTPITDAQKETLSGWLKQADPVSLWVDEYVHAAPGNEKGVLTKVMHRQFSGWAKNCDFPPVSLIGFSRSLKRWLVPLGGRHSKHLEGGSGYKYIDIRKDKGRMRGGYWEDSFPVYD